MNEPLLDRLVVLTAAAAAEPQEGPMGAKPYLGYPCAAGPSSASQPLKPGPATLSPWRSM